jgi:hypothetical protein
MGNLFFDDSLFMTHQNRVVLRNLLISLMHTSRSKHQGIIKIPGHPIQMMTEVKIGSTFAPWGNQFSSIPLRSH